MKLIEKINNDWTKNRAGFVDRDGENQQIDLHSYLFRFDVGVSERRNIWETELVKRI